MADRHGSTDVIARACRSVVDLDLLRTNVLSAIGRVVPFDGAFWAIVDPATLLFTRGVQVDIPHETAPLFAANEYLSSDVNAWTSVAADPKSMHSIERATAGRMEESERFREILQPVGFGDELRAVFADRSGVWGCVCLHRTLGAVPFSDPDADFLRRISPIVASAIRTAILHAAAAQPAAAPDGPGIVMLSEELEFIGATQAGACWLELLDDDDRRDGVPSSVYLLAAALRGTPEAAPTLPTARALTRSGWATIRPSWIEVGGVRQIAVLIDEPAPTELAPLIVSAYGLTPQESRIVELLCLGRSTAAISDELFISRHTVQDHMKSIFDKTGASNRRELVASLLSGQYLPRAMGGAPINARGQFDS